MQAFQKLVKDYKDYLNGLSEIPNKLIDLFKQKCFNGYQVGIDSDNKLFFHHELDDQSCKRTITILNPEVDSRILVIKFDSLSQTSPGIHSFPIGSKEGPLDLKDDSTIRWWLNTYKCIPPVQEPSVEQKAANLVAARIDEISLTERLLGYGMLGFTGYLFYKYLRSGQNVPYLNTCLIFSIIFTSGFYLSKLQASS